MSGFSASLELVSIGWNDSTNLELVLIKKVVECRMKLLWLNDFVAFVSILIVEELTIHTRIMEKFICCRSQLRVFLEQPLYEKSNLRRHSFGKGRRLGIQYFISQFSQRLAFKRFLFGSNFIWYYSKRPHIWLLCVWLSFDDFRSHILWIVIIIKFIHGWW